MQQKNIIDFVKQGSEKALNPSGLKIMIFAFWFIAFFLLIGGIVEKGMVLLFSVLIGLIALVYTIVTLIISRKPQTFRQGFVNNSVFSLFFSLFFLMSIMMFLAKKNLSLIYNLFIVLAYVIIQLLYLFIIMTSIKNGIYSKEKNDKKPGGKHIKLFALIGGISGVFIARTLFSDLEQDIVLTIAIICLFTASVLFSLGNVNFLKLYYIKKYNIDEKSR